MPFMLGFPPKPHSVDLLSPPHVVFGICGVNVFTKLPSRIPYNMVVHYAPKFKEWVLPQPQNLPKSAAHRALRQPYVGINILENIDVEALRWIICTMLEQSGANMSTRCFGTTPDFYTAIKVLRAWTVLDLPVAGTDSIRTYVLMELVTGPPISADKLALIWDNFDRFSDVVLQAADNFIEHHTAGSYMERESTEILVYIASDQDRRDFFTSLRYDPPANESGGDAVEALDPVETALSTHSGITNDPEPKAKTIHEKHGTRKVTPSDKKARERKDSIAMKKRLSRHTSTEGLRSVYDKEPQKQEPPFPPIHGEGKIYNEPTHPPEPYLPKAGLLKVAPKPDDLNVMSTLLGLFGKGKDQAKRRSQTPPADPTFQKPIGLGIALDGKLPAGDEMPTQLERKPRSEQRRKERRASLKSSSSLRSERDEESKYAGYESEVEK
ncbi:hypothetical protein BDV96DRAFT_684649 [Lophiotrema nucula]|uniref:Uncharacterized protein n=1 Tax=Lophiotrema nucula TaxID=690887 RepID=A0A6A5ZHT3_9PLEO|nr:hypothetical protein BDV96DRAFT_684649 [Lophiotrema nucula]